MAQIFDARGPIIHKRKESDLDKVAKALDVAQSAFGIAGSFVNIKNAIADRDLKLQQQETLKSDLARKEKGILTPGEFQKQTLGKFSEVPEGTSGAQAVQVQNPETGEVSKRFLTQRARPLTEKEEKLIGLQTRDFQQKITERGGKIQKQQQELAAKKAKSIANLENLDTQISRLSPRQENGQSIPPEVETGPVAGAIVKSPLGSIVKPGLTDVKNNIENIIFQSVRETFGAQVTRDEVVRLVDTTFNPLLSNDRNLERLNRLRTQISSAVQSGDVQQFKRIVKGSGKSPSKSKNVQDISLDEIEKEIARRQKAAKR